MNEFSPSVLAMRAEQRLAEKRKKLDEKHPIRSFIYYPKNLAVFGQDKVAIKIGCSRPPSAPPEEIPGPGAYEIATKNCTIPHKIQNRPETRYETISTNIDYLDLKPFSRSSSSAQKRGAIRSPYTTNDVPGPTYVPPALIDTGKKITIGKRVSVKYTTDVPGPGEYNPIRPSTTACSIPRSGQRSLWEGKEVSPGPGMYDVVPKLKKPKRWASKLRVLPKSRYGTRKEKVDDMDTDFELF